MWNLKVLFSAFRFTPEATARRAVEQAVLQTRFPDAKVAPATGTEPIDRLYPDLVRQRRITPEAMLYVHYFRDAQAALRFLQFHGAMRKQFGTRVLLSPVGIEGRRDDDVMADAVAESVSLLSNAMNGQRSAVRIALAA